MPTAVRNSEREGHTLLQGAVAGLAVGGVYAIIAVSVTLMAKLVRVINFAQAAVGMFGAFVAAHLAGERVPFVLAIAVGLVVGTLASVMVGQVISRWLPESTVSARSAVTVATLLLLISLSYIFFGTRPMRFRAIVSGTAFEVGDAVVSQVTVLMVALTLLVAVGAGVLLRRTRIGTQLRAIADRPTVAEMIAIPVRALLLGVWAFSGLVVTFVVIIVAPTQTADALSLSMLIIPATAAALLGAFRRLDLALVGGLLLGVVQGFAAQFSELALVRDWIPLVLIVLFLLWNQRKEVWDEAR